MLITGPVNAWMQESKAGVTRFRLSTARIPAQIGNVTGLPNLTAAMSAHGYGGELMKKLCSENWMRVLERTWGG